MKTRLNLLVIAVLSFFLLDSSICKASGVGGNSPTSNTISSARITQTNEVFLYPAINSGVFSTELLFSVREAADFKVEIYDQNGQLSEFSKEIISEGLLLFNLDEQPAGNYTLVIEADGKTYVNSFQKVD